MSGDRPGIVCDDAPGFRMMLSALLREAGIDVVGEGESWDDAERLAPGCAVITLDLWMPEFDHTALARVRAAAPDATLAIVTALELDDAERRCEGVAVDLFLSKSAPPTEVAARIADQAALAWDPPAAGTAG